MENEIEVENKEKKGKGKTIVIVLLGLLLGGSAISNLLLWNKEKTSTQIANSKLDSIVALNGLKDSLYNELALEQEKVNQLRNELSLFQNENDSLLNIINEKEQKIASLRSMLSGGGSPSSLRALKDSINRFKSENLTFRTQVEGLIAENTAKNNELSSKDELISELQKQKGVLTSKVDIAAMPSVGPVTVVPQYQKKGVYLPIYKSKKVERLHITYDVLANKLTDKNVEKEFIVRVLNPDGIVLSNNNNNLSDISKVYTNKTKIEFDGKQKKIEFNFIQKPAYKKGKYKVELKDGDTVLDNFTFELI